jgi:hypothetical protein
VSCPLSARRTYFLGLQPGWLHAQGFLPSAQEVEQYFFPFTSTGASLQEQALLLHPAFASFSIAAISTSMRRSVSRIYSHGACHGGGSAVVNAPRRAFRVTPNGITLTESASSVQSYLASQDSSQAPCRWPRASMFFVAGSHVGAIASYRRRYEYRSAASILGSTRHRPGGTGVSDGAVIPGSGAGVVE